MKANSAPARASAPPAPERQPPRAHPVPQQGLPGAEVSGSTRLAPSLRLKQLVAASPHTQRIVQWQALVDARPTCSPVQVAGQRATAATAMPLQRYIDEYAPDDIIDDVDLRVRLAELIQSYNKSDALDHRGYYSENLINGNNLKAQLDKLEEIDGFIAKASSRGSEGPTINTFNLTVLDRVRKNIEGDRVNLKQHLDIVHFAESTGVSASRMFELHYAEGGRAAMTEAVTVAKRSEQVATLLRLIVNKHDLSLQATLKVLAHMVDNGPMRKYMFELAQSHPSFDAANLERFAAEVELLTDFFHHMVEVRNLPKDSFVPLLTTSIEHLFRGEADYQTIAATLAMALPQPVSMLQLATELSDGMRELGYRIYLAGGGAIRFSGGPRPVADLDFRMDPMPGLTSFASFHGKRVLRMADRLLELSRNESRKGLSYDAFSAAGKKAMTIGTHNWYRIEISISINQGFPHLELVPLEVRLHSDEYIEYAEAKAGSNQKSQGKFARKFTEKAKGVLAVLSPEDLLRDKLKTLITRTKDNETSYKKVAQDLFDILSLVTMLRDQEDKGEKRDEVQSAKPQPPAPLNRDQLSQHLGERVDQYRVQNLEPAEHDMLKMQTSKVVERMLYRLVITARKHQAADNPRSEVLAKLMSRSALDVSQALKDLASIDVAALKNAFDGFDIDAWFETWNLAGALPDERMKVPAPNPTVESLSASPKLLKAYPSDALVAHILEGAPPNLDLTDDLTCILYILYRSQGGLRKLSNSNRAIEVMAAFSESVGAASFRELYAKYSKLKYFKPQPEGLELLEEGKKVIEEKIKVATAGLIWTSDGWTPSD